MTSDDKGPAIWPEIIKDMIDRDALGRSRYGGPLVPFDDRDSLWDMYEELLDAVAYVKKEILRRELLLKELARLRKENYDLQERLKPRLLRKEKEWSERD